MQPILYLSCVSRFRSRVVLPAWRGSIRAPNRKWSKHSLLCSRDHSLLCSRDHHGPMQSPAQRHRMLCKIEEASTRMCDHESASESLVSSSSLMLLSIHTLSHMLRLECPTHDHLQSRGAREKSQSSSKEGNAGN
jgi:hypothetical protein